jgi:ribosomal protein S18 acetylase RimI-like enzyme
VIGMPSVELRPMSEERFAAWCDGSVRTFAEELAQAASLPLAVAEERAEAQFAESLPDGVATAAMDLMVVLDGAGVEVGVLWTGPHPLRANAGYVYEIEIVEHRRGDGLGRAALLEAERRMRDAGLAAVGLNVFGFNDRAQSLYASLGYGVVATQMLKLLDEPPA